jgi:hypothetical protein
MVKVLEGIQVTEIMTLRIMPIHFIIRTGVSRGSWKSFVAPQGSVKHSPNITDLTHPKPERPSADRTSKTWYTEAHAAADQGPVHLLT